MCVITERDYVGVALDAEAVGNFASAAVLTTLTPADWQICQDARQAAGEMALRALADGATTLVVTITVHARDIEVSVKSDVLDEHTRLTPRREFTSEISCAA